MVLSTSSDLFDGDALYEQVVTSKDQDFSQIQVLLQVRDNTPTMKSKTSRVHPTKDQPDVQSEDQPNVQSEDQPDVQSEDQPDVQSQNQNDIQSANQSDKQHEDQREDQQKNQVVVQHVITRPPESYSNIAQTYDNEGADKGPDDEWSLCKCLNLVLQLTKCANRIMSLCSGGGGGDEE
ncbi:uncharacterized protein [Asterias amurensis]|uniref:uncharacterized protein isoform X2 n=1 Tax=Asterias amurensis TaxID=7602 RepID=UPI003AB44B67